MSKIVVCVPTYKRPLYLEKCINSLLDTKESIDFDICIIDNDKNQSSKKLVHHCFKDIIYLVEKHKGIPYVRNTAVEYCKDKYEYIAFIDDDEEVTYDWLKLLKDSMEEYEADVVHAPIISKFDSKPPAWAQYSNFIFYNPKRMKTGTILKCCSTGNVLIKSNIFNNPKNRFDVRLSNTGGSDTLFFTSLDDNYKMIWNNDAIVYENIPKTRQTLKWNLMRVYRNGNATALIYNIQGKKLNKLRLQSINKLISKILILPIVFILNCIFYNKYKMRHTLKLISRIFYILGFINGTFGKKYAEYEVIHGK